MQKFYISSPIPLDPDMTFYGLVYMARDLSLKYGDGLSNNQFWRESLYFYNRFGKVVKAVVSTDAPKVLSRGGRIVFKFSKIATQNHYLH